MTYQWWPLFDLRLAGPALTLRPMREADLDLLAAELPPDLEMNPARTRFGLLGEHVGRGVSRHQEYWQAYGSWRPRAWRLNFVVTVRGSGAGAGAGAGAGSGVGSGSGGRVIGVQELEGVDNYLTLRTVDTSSSLVRSARGQGYGKEMRRAVLALAFGPLGAQAAITSAWHDNAASLGVSAALGYRPNGETLHEREPLTGTGDPAESWPDVMVHLRMKRDEWLASGQGADIEITGFDPCRPLFGLPRA